MISHQYGLGHVLNDMTMWRLLIIHKLVQYNRNPHSISQTWPTCDLDRHHFHNWVLSVCPDFCPAPIWYMLPPYIMLLAGPVVTYCCCCCCCWCWGNEDGNCCGIQVPVDGGGCCWLNIFWPPNMFCCWPGTCCLKRSCCICCWIWATWENEITQYLHVVTTDKLWYHLRRHGFIPCQFD